MNILKFIKLTALTILLTTANVQAQEKSVRFDTDQSGGGAAEVYKQELQALKTRIANLANTIGEIKDCHSSRLIYTSSGCTNPVTPESDPSKAAHAAKAKPPTICPTGHAHQWNGTSWSCKEIRKTVNSGVVNDGKTWRVISGESCWDHFRRKCTSADDTCPGTSNPIGLSCTGGYCSYAKDNANNFVEFMCQ